MMNDPNRGHKQNANAARDGSHLRSANLEGRRVTSNAKRRPPEIKEAGDSPHRPSNHAFTLIELMLCVIIVIAILAGLHHAGDPKIPPPRPGT